MPDLGRFSVLERPETSHDKTFSQTFLAKKVTFPEKSVIKEIVFC